MFFTFLFKLLHDGFVYCPEVLNKINFMLVKTTLTVIPLWTDLRDYLTI